MLSVEFEGNGLWPRRNFVSAAANLRLGANPLSSFRDGPWYSYDDLSINVRMTIAYVAPNQCFIKAILG